MKEHKTRSQKDLLQIIYIKRREHKNWMSTTKTKNTHNFIYLSKNEKFILAIIIFSPFNHRPQQYFSTHEALPAAFEPLPSSASFCAPESCQQRLEAPYTNHQVS